MTRPLAVSAVALPGAELCVHCGFCLQACPTYLALDDENDSPRGRIVLMKAIAEGTIALDDAGTQRHIDRCLGCRACETACPSGVPYGHLIEATRERIAGIRALPAVARVILFVFARPALLAMAMWAARLARASRLPSLLGRLPGAPGFAMAMLASTRRAVTTPPYAATPPAGEAARATVATLAGCVMEGLFAPANRATERTLAVNGYALTGAPGQRCCGALHAHAGDAVGARRLARENIAAFEHSGADYVAVNSAGCGAMMKEYAHLLEHLDPQAPGKDPKTLLQELLQARKIPLPQYAVVATQGAAHKQLFQVECQIPQLAIRTTGFGASRRIAEQEAAQRAFAQTQK